MYLSLSVDLSLLRWVRVPCHLVSGSFSGDFWIPSVQLVLPVSLYVASPVLRGVLLSHGVRMGQLITATVEIPELLREVAGGSPSFHISIRTSRSTAASHVT